MAVGRNVVDTVLWNTVGEKDEKIYFTEMILLIYSVRRQI